jgi:lysylphosphatidylglycerol synthetase-like protein (DUF2156 family)
MNLSRRSCGSTRARWWVPRTKCPRLDGRAVYLKGVRPHKPSTFRVVLRRLLLIGLTFLLLAIAWHATIGGVRQLPRAVTLGQRLETGIQIVCGLLSLLVILSLRWRRWAARIRMAWAASFVATAGLSSIVWGPPMLPVTVAFVFGSAVVTWLIVRGLDIALRVESSDSMQPDRRHE